MFSNYHSLKNHVMKRDQASSSSGSRSNSKNESGLMKLFESELQDIYGAEKALTKAIPKMIENASSEDLVSALREHLAVTEEQVARLEQVFEGMGRKTTAKKCEAMEGLVKEAEELMEEADEGVVRDAAIISAAQKVEHYEIASYGTLCAFAKTLGLDEAADLLQETLDEEKEADVLLTEIAESHVNVEALQTDSDDE
jgi:ferritin-like metal-binding protein YciE